MTEWRTDEPTTRSRVTVAVGTVRRLARITVSYALFAAGVIALYSFFAQPFGWPTVAWWAPVVPSVAAPTEAQGTVINVTPVVVGIVTSAAGVWLR